MIGKCDVRFGKAVGDLFLQRMPSKKVDVVASLESCARHISEVHVASTDLVGINAVCDKMYDRLLLHHTLVSVPAQFCRPKVWQFAEFRKFIVVLPHIRVSAYAPARLYAEHFK